VRKIYAAYQLFIYTLLGSVFVLISILDLALSKGSTSFEIFLTSFFFEKRELFF
jgi:NADH-ubiquinone oxidoreductase chain 4